MLLAFFVALGAIGWGIFVKQWAKEEAREAAEIEVKRWLQDEALPMIMREVSEFLKTFREERPISDADVADMVAALGDDGKEDDNGEE